MSVPATLARGIGRTQHARPARAQCIATNVCLVRVCRQDLSCLFYLLGILGALELEYNDRVLLGVLVYTPIGILDNAENEPAVFFCLSRSCARCMCRRCSAAERAAADAAVARDPRKRRCAQTQPHALDPAWDPERAHMGPDL